MTQAHNNTAVEQILAEAGFDAFSVSGAESVDPARLKSWLEAGRHGDMEYMAEYGTGRADPRQVLPEVRSILCVALSYYVPDNELAVQEGKIARYARGRDYHKTLKQRLHACADRLREQFPEAMFRVAVDTAPLMEKPIAARSGLGWQGKHTVLISQSMGSYFVTGEILTDLELPPGDPTKDRCGSCDRCITSCPTNAITAPYELDASRCISYWTIESREPIPRWIRPLVGAWIFGCDLCLEVCPWNAKPLPTSEPDFRPRPATNVQDVRELLRLDEEGFTERFAGTPVMRAKRDGLVRNACVALGNLLNREAVPDLMMAMSDSSALVRGHAAWALGRIGGAEARAALQDASQAEEVEWVQSEINAALADIVVREEAA